MVLFCHVTSRVEGRKDDGLLRDVGGNSFPFVVSLDASGKVLASLGQRARTIDTFRELMKEGAAFADLMARASKGDAAAKLEYFPKGLKLGHFKLEEARKYAATMKNVPPESKAEIDGLIVGLEVQDLMKPLEGVSDRARAEALWQEIGKKLWEFDKAGKVPAQEDLVRDFYAMIVIYAEKEKDIPAFERGLSVLKDRFGQGPMSRFIKTKEEALNKLKEEKEEKAPEKPPK